MKSLTSSSRGRDSPALYRYLVVGEKGGNLDRTLIFKTPVGAAAGVSLFPGALQVVPSSHSEVSVVSNFLCKKERTVLLLNVSGVPSVVKIPLTWRQKGDMACKNDLVVFNHNCRNRNLL